MASDTFTAFTTFVLQWIVAPLTLLFLLRFGWHFLARAKGDAQKLSSAAAFLAGFVAFVIAVAHLNPPVGFSWLAASTTFVAGFMFLWAVKWMVPAGHVGWLIMILTATSLIGLYCYVQLALLRSTILSGALGLALGVLLHIMIMPMSILRNLVAEEQSVDLARLVLPQDEDKTQD